MKLFLMIIPLLILPGVQATFSVIACEPETGLCGGTVTTNNLAAGASVIHIETNNGALVSQFATPPARSNGIKVA